MKTSISLVSEHCLNADFLKQIKESGFDGVDFIFDKTFFTYADKNYVLDKICENFDAAGLACAQIHFPYYSMLTSSELLDEEMEARILYTLTHMNMLGAKWGALHPRSAVNYGFDRERSLEDNIRSIQTYLETAEKYDVGIAIENLPFFADNPQNRFFGFRAEELCELIDRLNHPLVGVCWDFGHSNLSGFDQFGRPYILDYDTKKELETMGNRVKIVHAHDNYGDYDFHHCPTFGTVRWYDLLPVLFKSGFSGYFSLECEMKLPLEGMLYPYLKMCGKVARSLTDEIEAILTSNR